MLGGKAPQSLRFFCSDRSDRSIGRIVFFKNFKKNLLVYFWLKNHIKSHIGKFFWSKNAKKAKRWAKSRKSVVGIFQRPHQAPQIFLLRVGWRGRQCLCNEGKP